MPYEVVQENRLRPVPVYRNVTCDRCGSALPEQAGFPADDSMQYDNALIVSLRGAYGMFVDPYDEPAPGEALDPRWDKVLCHECAHAFFEFCGWDASGTHTHVAAEHGGTQHPDHHRVAD